MLQESDMGFNRAKNQGVGKTVSYKEKKYKPSADKDTLLGWLCTGEWFSES